MHMHNVPQAFAQGGDATNNVSGRHASSALGFLLMAQLQFLATLSLVDHSVTNDVGKFSGGLRLAIPDVRLYFTI